ncbi:MAG: Glutamine amidotransferase class-I [Candidatus Roizmanbacteria bacterium GW2011_GWA2_35_19]|uniref:Glutamine amidotransferase class-I n=2 Tax=Candidatus Roizmaniibacteriota TaxID=1752723 RepID=A0A0G0C988_9BACT|nr:MAG: Glutamine amidotransferase class-I [Candidatus Roizmanbacteria bacterium GW2011_GWC2_35_12]KKP72691.1 MAG: Glutamine amidotransferase class-I [Candidatus Roizmanbacteria bacterium GW2011_GWA2_35_19]
MHESFEAPGAIEKWAKYHDFPVTYTRFYQNDKLRDNIDEFDYLIVMGGPQCPITTELECPHFHTKEEIEFIKQTIAKKKSLLGVCLGAQLIGEALGAKFKHSPSREIGVYDLTLTKEAKNDPIFSTFPKKFAVGHWHGDMPGLTPDTKILATSKGCPRQIVRFSPKIYGFQCHFEFTPESMADMIKNNAQELNHYKNWPFIESAETLRKHDFSEMNNLLFKFLDYMESLVSKNSH